MADNSTQSTTEMSVTVEWKDVAAPDVLQVDIGGVDLTFNVSTSSGTHTFDFTVPTDGSGGTISADFNTGPASDNEPFTAPDQCADCSLTISGVSAGSCSTPANTYSFDFTVSWSDVLIGQTISVSAAGNSQTIIAGVATGNQILNFTGLATGVSESIVAEITGALGCSQTANFTAPDPCPPCELDIDFIITGSCYLDGGNSEQDITVGVSWAFASDNIIDVEIDGTTVSLNTGGNASGTGTVTIIGINADNSIHTVNAAFTTDTGCNTSDTYTADDVCPACDLQITGVTTNGDCVYDSTSQLYVDSLVIGLSWANALSGTAIKITAIDNSGAPLDTIHEYFFIRPLHSLIGGTADVTIAVPITGETGNLIAAMLPDFTCANNTVVNYTSSEDVCDFPLGIGNHVWEDINNNGLFDPTENGISNVILSLYQDVDMDSIPDGPALGKDTTDADGYYAFEIPDPGKYLVGVDSSNFETGAPLDSMVSSYVTEIDVNLDRDSTDNGSNAFFTPVGGIEVFSSTVEIVEGAEPLGEYNGPGGSVFFPDNNANYTVDFGFFKDCDGDGVANQLETSGDRDNDGIINPCDYDPSGYIYCTSTGELVSGGSVNTFSTPPGGTVTLIEDGATGFYQFFTNGFPVFICLPIHHLLVLNWQLLLILNRLAMELEGHLTHPCFLWTTQVAMIQ